MEKILFKYYNMFLYSELELSPTEEGWYCPKNMTGFGYNSIDKILFYDGRFKEEVIETFGVTKDIFEQTFTDWFETRYEFPVSKIL